MNSSNDQNSHAFNIDEQFTKQAELFANSPALHHSDALNLLVKSASPKRSDRLLDVACGPGSVAVAFAEHVEHATGLDATEAMLDQARVLADKRELSNTSWKQGSVYELPFEDKSFDIVSCRFAFHHFQDPVKAFYEMKRVCKVGGRVVLCDAIISEDAVKALAFNEMERYRDPSTVEFRSFDYLSGLFVQHGLSVPDASYYQVPVELEALFKVSFPVNDDYDGLREIIVGSIDGDKMGVNARHKGEQVRFEYSAVVLVSEKV